MATAPRWPRPGLLRSGLLAMLLSMAASIQAHHSFTMFDLDNPIELEGEVVKFEYLNPHSWITINVEQPDGTSREWDLEFGPINMLSRRGWKHDSLEQGDYIHVSVEPMRNGDPIARLIASNFLAGPEDLPEPVQRVPNAPRPEAVAMEDSVARDFNGVWLSANNGLHFDDSVPASEQVAPLTPEYQAILDKRKRDAELGISSNDPTAACIPAGFPRFLSMVFPGEIIQNDNQLNWYVEWNQETLRIYLDGRPEPENPFPTYTGFSTGHWEGNTLVTNTRYLRDDKLIDTTGVPHSGELSVDMRMTKLTPDYFQVEITLNDPVALTEPWSSVKYYKRAPAGYLAQEYSCFEGNRHVINEDGSIDLDI